MLRSLRPAIVMIALFTLLLGVAYPLAVTGVAQVAFPSQADGSLIREVIFPISRPNGVGLSPDEKTLYAAQTMVGRLMKFTITAPGRMIATAALVSQNGA